MFCGSLGIIGIFALFLTAARRRRAAQQFFAVLVLPLCTFWLGWAVIMQGHYIIHEYHMILASPLLAIGVTCIYSLLDDTSVGAGTGRGKISLLDQSCLALRDILLGVSAAAITVRGEAEPWQLANFGRRIKAEVPAGAIVVTSEMSMVQTYYAKRHVIRGVPDGAHLESKLGMIRTYARCALYFAVRRQSGKISWRARPPAAGL